MINKSIIKIIDTIKKTQQGDSFVSFFESFCGAYEDVNKKNRWSKIKFSAGVSDIDIFQGFKDAINFDINNGLYKKYADPQGDGKIRYVLSLYYNGYFNTDVFFKKDFCLTTGATGAIYSFFDWYSRKYPSSKVLIIGPSYYVFKLECEKYKITYDEICLNKNKEKFYHLNEIENNIDSDTKLIILSNPSNPTGEFLNNLEIRSLIILAKKNGIFILLDSLFLDLPMESKKISIKNNFITLGDKLNYLENIFIVQSWSKNINLPGLRIGYIFSKNTEVMEAMTLNQEQTSFFSPPSNYQSLIILDTYIRLRCILFGFKKDIFLIQKRKKVPQELVEFFSIEKNQQIFFDYIKYQQNMISFYKKNRDLGVDILSNVTNDVSKDLFGFNKFIKLKLPYKVSEIDFIINLFIQTGVKLQTGSYFGIVQEKTTDELWMRFTYANNSVSIENGSKKISDFIKKFNPNSKSFISTNLNFTRLEHWGDTKVTFIKDKLKYSELPIVAVKCYMLKNKKLLLVKDNKRGWDVPGGHIEKDENPENAAKRELNEEANCHTDSLILLGYLLCSNKGEKNKYPKDSLIAIYGSSKFSINFNKKLMHETFDIKLTKLTEIKDIHHNWTGLKEKIVDSLIKNY